MMPAGIIDLVSGMRVNDLFRSARDIVNARFCHLTLKLFDAGRPGDSHIFSAP